MGDRCPKCGAEKQYAHMANGISVPLCYACGTPVDWRGERMYPQSDKCRIRELEAKLATSQAECKRLQEALQVAPYYKPVTAEDSAAMQQLLNEGNK